MRVTCKKAFPQTDCSKRVASVILRRAALVPMDYTVGDMISSKRKQGSKRKVNKLWSTPPRFIGFEGEKTAWGVCEGVLVCVATDKIRPCSAEETLAYLYVNKNKPSISYTRARSGEQENFIDARSVKKAEKEQRQLDADDARKREMKEMADVESDSEKEEPIEEAPKKNMRVK